MTRLDLYINNRFFDTMKIPDLSVSQSFYNRVNDNFENVEIYTMQLKAMFFKQILRADCYNIYLVISNDAEIQDDEIYSQNKIMTQ